MRTYWGQWCCLASVMASFEELSLKYTCILFACYGGEGYEGAALVLFSERGRLWEVNGSHCSCMGLEGQWEPEATTLEALKLRRFDWMDASEREGLQAVLAKLEAQYAKGGA